VDPCGHRWSHRRRLRDALWVWEHEYYPQWYVPLADVAGALVVNGDTFDGGSRGPGARVDIDVDGV